MDLIIKRGSKSDYGACYTLVKDEQAITSHFCSNDNFAHSDLFQHDETKAIIKDMPLTEFYKIVIIN